MKRTMKRFERFVFSRRDFEVRGDGHIKRT